MGIFLLNTLYILIRCECVSPILFVHDIFPELADLCSCRVPHSWRGFVHVCLHLLWSKIWNPNPSHYQIHDSMCLEKRGQFTPLDGYLSFKHPVHFNQLWMCITDAVHAWYVFFLELADLYSSSSAALVKWIRARVLASFSWSKIWNPSQARLIIRFITQCV